MGEAHDVRGRARDGREREVVRQPVEVRLLRLVQQVARVEHRVVALPQIQSGKGGWGVVEQRGEGERTDLHDDAQAVLREHARRKFRGAVRLALVPVGGSSATAGECSKSRYLAFVAKSATAGGSPAQYSQQRGYLSRRQGEGRAVGLLEQVGHEERLARVMERGDGEFELVGELCAEIISIRRTVFATMRSTYPDQVVEVDGLVAVSVHLPPR